MNLQQAKQQANVINQHNQTIYNQIQHLADTIQNSSIEPAQKKLLLTSLQSTALSFTGLYQETTALVQGMASYIHTLESNQMNMQSYAQPQGYPQVPVQQQPQQNGGFLGLGGNGNSGGFWNTIWKSAQQGAGFEIGRDVVNGIFKIF